LFCAVGSADDFGKDNKVFISGGVGKIHCANFQCFKSLKKIKGS